ncbi:hypothetical protein BASA81_000334 [Batrachochytrium salamandrivorans]|nr:hypothetical protein BASA81_000334 [Batrachochytrium salamandrivorans]
MAKFGAPSLAASTGSSRRYCCGIQCSDLWQGTWQTHGPSVRLLQLQGGKFEYVQINTVGVQINALAMLENFANNLDNAREMVTQNPTLVPLIMAKVESNLEPIMLMALEVLSRLAFHVDNKREMVTKNPKLVPLLVPQNEAEVRQWLSKHKRGEEIADKLVKKDLVDTSTSGRWKK